MTEAIDFSTNKELFGHEFDAQFFAPFEGNGTLDFNVPSSVTIDQLSNDAALATNNDMFVSLADIERPDMNQNLSCDQGFPQDSTVNFEGHFLFDGGFPGEVELNQELNEDIFGWSRVNGMEQPGAIQYGNLADTSALQVDDHLHDHIGDQILSVSQNTDIVQAVPSAEELMSENARLKALLESKNADKVPARSPLTPKTPARKKSQPKTPKSKSRASPIRRPRPVPGKVTPADEMKMSPAARAICQQMGPIEELWSPNTSPERRREIERQLSMSMTYEGPRFSPAKDIAAAQPIAAAKAEKPKSPQTNTQSPHISGVTFSDDKFAFTEESQRVESPPSETAQYLQTLITDAPQTYQASQFESEQPLTPGARLLEAFSPKSTVLSSTTQFTPLMTPQSPSLEHYSHQGVQWSQNSNTNTFCSNNTITTMSPPQVSTPSPATMARPRQTTPQVPEGIIMHNGFAYSPAASSYSSSLTSNSTTNSTQQSPSPTPKSAPARKSRAAAKPRGPAKRTTSPGAPAYKVTKPKPKPAHKRTASAPSSTTDTTTPRTLQQLHNTPFINLSHAERCRLLLPLLQGIDPTTGLKVAPPGRLAPPIDLDFDAIGADMFGMQDPSPMPNMVQNVGPQAQAHTHVHVPSASHDADMVQQAARELGMGVNIEFGAASRQSEALQRADALRAAGKRR